MYVHTPVYRYIEYRTRYVTVIDHAPPPFDYSQPHLPRYFARSRFARTLGKRRNMAFTREHSPSSHCRLRSCKGACSHTYTPTHPHYVHVQVHHTQTTRSYSFSSRTRSFLLSGSFADISHTRGSCKFLRSEVE